MAQTKTIESIRTGETVYVPEGARLGRTGEVAFTGLAQVLVIDDHDETAMVRALGGFLPGMVQWVNVSSLREVAEHDADASLTAA